MHQFLLSMSDARLSSEFNAGKYMENNEYGILSGTMGNLMKHESVGKYNTKTMPV